MTHRKVLAALVGIGALYALWANCWVPFECNLASKVLESAVQAAAHGDPLAHAFLRDNIDRFVEIEKRLPQDQALNISIGSAYSMLGDNESALAMYSKGLIYDQRPEIYFNMAAIYGREGLVDKAYNSYLYAARFNPDLAARISDEPLRIRVTAEVEKRQAVKR